MYKNHEGYADPTAGTALAHIIYEQRQEKRNSTTDYVWTHSKEQPATFFDGESEN